MKSLLPLITLLGFSSLNLHGQIDFEDVTGGEQKIRFRNSIGVNFLNDAAKYSLHWETVFNKEKKYPITFRLGFGVNQKINILGFSSEGAFIPDDPTYTFSQQITFLKKKNDSYWEFGLGGSVGGIEDINATYTLYPLIGYRWYAMDWKNTIIRFIVSIPVAKSPEGILLLTGDQAIFWPFGISFCRLL